MRAGLIAMALALALALVLIGWAWRDLTAEPPKRRHLPKCNRCGFAPCECQLLSFCGAHSTLDPSVRCWLPLGHHGPHGPNWEIEASDRTELDE